MTSQERSLKRKSGQSPPRVQQTAVDFTLKESLRSTSYWLIILSTSVRYIIIGGVHLHWVPMSSGRGTGEVTGAWFIGFQALAAWPLILLNGVLGDRFSKRLVLMSGHTSLLIAMFVFVNSESLWSLYLFSVLFSYGEGVSPTNYSIIGEYFGRRVFATLRGFLTTFTTVAIFSPVYAGWVFDRYNDYTLALFTYAASLCSASPCCSSETAPQGGGGGGGVA